MIEHRPSPTHAASGAPARYDRAALLTGVLLISIAAVSWVALFHQGNTWGMGAQPSMHGAMAGGMDQEMGASAFLSPLGAAAYLAAWGVMMAAMMLPSATPLIALYAAIQRRSPPERRGIPAVLFALVYLVMWLLAGAPVYAASAVIAAVAEASPTIVRLLPYGVVLTLLAAGIYQFTPLKSRCLTVCQSPLGFLMGHWRAGAAGALRMALAQAVLLELDWAHLDSSEGSDERAERRHRATGLSADDRRERLLLLVVGAIVDDEPEGPVPLAHLLGRVGHRHHVAASQVSPAVVALLDMESDRHRATALSRPRGEI